MLLLPGAAGGELLLLLLALCWRTAVMAAFSGGRYVSYEDAHRSYAPGER